MLQGEASLRVGKGVARHQAGDVPGLGRVGAQELEAGRRVEEKVLDLYGSSCWSATRLSMDNGTTLQANDRADFFPFRTGGEGQPGHGGDARQRLATKAQRPHAIEVFGGRELARGVTLKGQIDLGGVNPAAVIGHADQAASAFDDLDAHIARPGIDCVLDQFLDHRSGSLYHLAGSDLGSHFGRQDADRHDRALSGAFPIAAARERVASGLSATLQCTVVRDWCAPVPSIGAGPAQAIRPRDQPGLPRTRGSHRMTSFRDRDAP